MAFMVPLLIGIIMCTVTDDASVLGLICFIYFLIYLLGKDRCCSLIMTTGPMPTTCITPRCCITNPMKGGTVFYLPKGLKKTLFPGQAYGSKRIFK